VIDRLSRLVGASPAAAFRLKQIVEKGDFDEELLKSVAAMGQPFTIVANDPPLGYWAVVGIDASGARHGAVTARGDGMGAAAWGDGVAGAGGVGGVLGVRGPRLRATT